VTDGYVEYGGFSIRQGGMIVAGGSGPYEAMRREAAHYAMMYRQDGPVKVRVWRNRKRRQAIPTPSQEDRT
jgi:hypothetical protein